MEERLDENKLFEDISRNGPDEGYFEEEIIVQPDDDNDGENQKANKQNKDSVILLD